MAEEFLSDHDRLDIPDTLPMLPVRDVVVFPYMILPLFVGRDSSIHAVDEALSEDRLVFLASQKNASQEDPLPDDIYETGTVAIIMRMRKLPDGRVKILVQGLLRACINRYIQEEPFYLASIDRIVEPPPPSADELEVEALMRDVRENLERLISLGKILSPDILTILDDVQEPGRLADLVASNLGLRVEASQQILETSDAFERLRKVNENLVKEAELLGMQARIQSQAKEEMTRMQREFFLREQLRAIRAELGDSDSKLEEMEELRQKVFEANMPEEAEKEALKQLSRLESMHPDAAEASMVRGHLDWLIEIPWDVATRDSLDLQRAREILDEDHYGLDKIKERILEFLGVRKLKKKMKGPILCFIGPPGVGKTSLGKSIARALGRKFVRVALGGVRDEAEIRGHRRTYVGSMPGRIIQGLKQAGTNNPVFMIDEVDKLGSDTFRGDPSSALLEVLDPEQNDTFRDHYLNVPFDLSKVMFIATANQDDPIPPALADRMEKIYLSGYTEEDKTKIAREYLIPKQLDENGITDDHLTISASALQAIISDYTREAGLRNLEREIAALCRKVARAVAEGEKVSASITTTNLHKYLGPRRNLPELEDRVDEAGIATGLAWTRTGGQILFVEATIMEGKGTLTLTGHLGDVMKESARAALSYVRSRAHQFDLDAEFFSESEIHIHVPSGAIPKDGPSAGITMATALVSALTEIPTHSDVAMTGEITLRGRVLPIGGLKEKVLAARRAGIKTIILPAANAQDLEEIPSYVRRKLRFVPVKTLEEALAVALVEAPQTRLKPKKRGRSPEVTGTA